MSLFGHGSADFRGQPECAADFIISLQRETRRTLPQALVLQGSFDCAGLQIPRCSVQTEEGVRYLSLNVPVQDLGRIARGSKSSHWTDIELGSSLLTDIIESTKSLEFGAFKIFADEQEFVFSAVTLGPEGVYREFGRIGDQSFLRFFFQMRNYAGDDYASSANEHFMDRLSKMFDIVEDQGLRIADAWAKYLFSNSIDLGNASFPSAFQIPGILSDEKFRILLSDVCGIIAPQDVFPQDVPLVLDREFFLLLRVPISETFLEYHLNRDHLYKTKDTLGVLEGLRMSIQNELDRTELSDYVSVSLRSASDLSRIDSSESDSIADIINNTTSHFGRYLVSFNLELPGALSSEELKESRNEVVRALLNTLKVFSHCLGK